MQFASLKQAIQTRYRVDGEGRENLHWLLELPTSGMSFSGSIRAPKPELYDLSRDPGEQNPLPLSEAVEVRQKLLTVAKKHMVESCQSRDFDRRMASQVREYRLELARSATHARN